MDAADDSRVREIVLQWATRLGKSFFGQCLALKNAHCNPAPQMLVSATEKLAKEVTARTYEMARQRPALNSLLVRARKFQRQDLIEFRRSKVYVAWARSVSTLADKNVKFGHANEIDKFEHASTSKEADPEKLFTDRFKDCQSARKVLFESTPTVYGESRIERRLLNGTHCRYYVPCHGCRRYQTIDLGKEDEAGGIKWDRTDSGLTNSEHARRTARYECRHCGARWEDHHRPWAIRRGVWSPAGCEVDDDIALAVATGELAEPWNGWRKCPWIKGSPLRDGDAASYQLSSFYALSLTWGDIAREFIESKDRPQLFRNFKNQWEGVTWTRKKSKSTPETVGDRLRGSTPRGTVPEWGLALSVAIDRQAGQGDRPFVVFGVVAHGLDDRAALIEYGIADTPDAIWGPIVERFYPHADGGAPLKPCVAGIDSGWKTHETYLFCAAHPGLLPLKGSTNDLGGRPYHIAPVDDSRTGVSGQLLLHVNTDYWETELQSRLEERSVDGSGCLVLCPEASRDPEFLEQLCNGILTDEIDSRGNAKTRWKKKDEHFPNDFRDVMRYSLCLMRAWINTNSGTLPYRATNGGIANNAGGVLINPGDSRPDGRPW